MNNDAAANKRIAVIGSGLAGLTAAHLLQRRCNDEQVEVHIFEKAQNIGMDSASIDVLGRDGKVHRVDSPMRAVQGGYYTRLLKLYKELGIELEKSNFTYSFFQLSSVHGRTRDEGDDRPRRSNRSTNASDEKTLNSAIYAKGHAGSATASRTGSSTQKTTTFIYNGGNGISLRPFSFPSRSSSTSTFKDYSSYPSLSDLCFFLLGIITTTYRVLIFGSNYIYLLLLSFYHVYFQHTSSQSSHPLNTSSLRTFLNSTYLSQSFINEILIPLFSCVATCSPSEILEYPASEILEYIAKTFATDHYVVKGGVRQAVRRLLEGIPKDNIHLGCELVSLRKIAKTRFNTREDAEEDTTKSELELKDTSGQTWSFDHVIFASQANQAGLLLGGYYKALSDDSNASSTASDSVPSYMSNTRLEKERLEALSKFQYTTSIVINHYDEEGTLPSASSDRRMLNIARWHEQDQATSSLLGGDEEKIDHAKQLGRENVMATHDLSILNPNCITPANYTPSGILEKSSRTVDDPLNSSHGHLRLLQTTNPTVNIKEEYIVSKKIFERARVTLESREILKRFLAYPGQQMRRMNEEQEEVGCYQGLGGIWFVGSWAAEGIPLLEGCVVSAERAIEAICR